MWFYWNCYICGADDSHFKSMSIRWDESGKYSFGEKNVLNEILNYIKNTDYHIRCSVLSIIQLILEDENCTEEWKRKIKTTLTELLKREKANAVKFTATSQIAL